MGRRDRVVADQSLARDHAAGSSITLLQPLVHAELGALGYEWPRHWVGHLRRADEAHDRLLALHDRLSDVPVGPSNARHLAVDDYLFEVYGTGTEMVLNIALTAQHLADELERTAELSPYGGPVTERLRKAAAGAGLAPPASHPGYAGFVEVAKIRDALEHPKPGNTYNGADGEWDRVPLAWMLSDRPFPAYRRFRSLVDDLAGEWEEAKERFARPGTLTVSKRGVRSELQAKKARRG